MGVFVTKSALLMLLVAAGGVYGVHVATLPPIIGVAIGLSLLATLLPGAMRKARVSVSVVAAAVVTCLGLVMVWATNEVPQDRSTHVLRDLGWAEVALGGWLTYASLVMRRAETMMVHARFDDAARARWRQGDVAFGADLAGRLVVGAQPSWAALVVEVAWPEPRPELVTELLERVTTTELGEIVAIRERMRLAREPTAEARWELACIACDVICEARTRGPDDVGGAAVGRFVLAASRVVRSDDDATRIFAAVILPAIGR